MRTVELLFNYGHKWIPVGQVQINKDGSFSGNIDRHELLGLPDMVTKTDRPVAFTLVMLPHG